MNPLNSNKLSHQCNIFKNSTYFSLEKTKFSVSEKNSVYHVKKSQILKNVTSASSFCPTENYPIQTKLNCSVQKTNSLKFPNDNKVLYESRPPAPPLGSGGCPPPTLGLQTITKKAEKKLKVNPKPDDIAVKESTTKKYKVPLISTSNNDQDIIVNLGPECVGGHDLRSGLVAVSKKAEIIPGGGGVGQESEGEKFIKIVNQKNPPSSLNGQNFKVPLRSTSKNQKFNNETSISKNTALNKLSLSLNNTPEQNNLSQLCDHDHTYAKNPLKKSKKVNSKVDSSAVKKGSTKNLKVPLRSASNNLKKNNVNSMGKNIVLNKLKFFSLNVGGLKSKMISEDFEEQLNVFDIVCLLEI